MKIMIPNIDVVFRILQGLLTPVIACIAVYIAYQQHKTNRDKLRLDLYNKRYEVFYSLMKLLGHIFHNKGKVELEQVDEFSREAKEAVFLFDKDIVTYLDTIKKNSRDLWAAKEELKDVPRGKERSEKAREVTNLLHWSTNQGKIATEKFSKYLKFEERLKGKPMNLKKGFKRTADVLSIMGFLFWVGLIIYHIIDYGYERSYLDDIFILLVFGVLSFISIWVIYYVGLYIITGFQDNKPKDEQKE
jgi:hypothetical protein